MKNKEVTIAIAAWLVDASGCAVIGSFTVDVVSGRSSVIYFDDLDCIV
jgi:hypothetical protein